MLNEDGSIASAVGMMFLPQDPQLLKEAKNEIEQIFENYNLVVKAWRDVPILTSVLGKLLIYK